MSVMQGFRRKIGLPLGLVVALSALTCQGPADPVIQSQSAQTTAVPGPTLAAVAAATTRGLAPVDWAAVAVRPAFAGDRLPAQQRERIQGADLPVLLPPALDPSQVVLSRGPGWYAASYRLDGHSVLVSGSRVVFTRPGVPILGAPEGAPRLNRVQGIVELDFTTAGVAYTLNVECAQAASDPRCTGDGYAQQLAAALALLPTGGQP